MCAWKTGAKKNQLIATSLLICRRENDFKDSLEQISFHCPAPACGNEESQR
jgi:hypothetical protein